MVEVSKKLLSTLVFVQMTFEVVLNFWANIFLTLSRLEAFIGDFYVKFHNFYDKILHPKI